MRRYGPSRKAAGLRTAAAGTPAAFSSASHSSEPRPRNASSSAAARRGVPQSRRMALGEAGRRRSHSGAVANSGRPSARASASNCARVLAAVASQPSAVRNTPPPGLAAKAPLPTRAGAAPSIR